MTRRRNRRGYEREHDYYYARPRSRRSFWEGCQNALIVLVSALIVIFLLYAGITYRQYIGSSVRVVVIVVLAILGIAVIGLVIWLISAIWSFVSDRVTKIRLNKLEIHERRAEIGKRYPHAEIDPAPVMRSFAKTGQIAQDRAPLALAKTPRATPGQAGNAQGYQNRKISPIYYQDVFPLIEDEQILIGIKEDGSVRGGTWNDNKTTLILGNSSSGKTTTAIEKCVSAILSGALLVPCDPHAHKEDSLSRRLYPLKDFLWPGARFGVKHEDVYNNVEIVLNELNRRVQGGSAKIKLVLVVDEYNRLMRDETIAKKLATIVETIGQEGRGYNVYGVFICQRITGNAQLRKSVNSYIVHRVDETEAKLVLPGRFAKYAPELNTGLAIVKDADGAIEYLQQTIVTSEFIEMVVNTYREQVLALKARLSGPREPRVTRDLRKTERPTVKLAGEPRREPQPRYEPEPRREPPYEPQTQPRREPQHITAQGAGDDLYSDNVRVDLNEADFTPPRQAPRPAPAFHPAPRPAQVYQSAPAPAPAFLSPRLAGVPAPGYNEPAQAYQPAPAPVADLDFPPAPAQGGNIPIPDDIKQLALDMARAGKSRRKIREATGLQGAKYELLRRLLDEQGL